MSINQKITPVGNGQVDIELTCDRCGGPIVGTDKLGMHCKKRCYDKENKAALQNIENLFNMFGMTVPKEYK